MSWAHWTIVISLAAALSANAQTSNVTQCIPTYQWSLNSKGQTPCLVAAFLESACGTATSINSIPFNTHYLGPMSAQQDACKCSSVTYSMVSACGGCQGRTYQNWTTWSENCFNPTLTTFTAPLPSGAVEVPTWAFLDVSLTGNNFSPSVAENVAAGSPAPTTPIPASSSTDTSTTPASSSISSTPSSTPTSVPVTSGESKHTNAGAIAGGVVGGLVFLAVVVLGGLWWYMRRRRNSVQTNLTFDNRALVSSPPVMSQATGSSGPLSQSVYDTSEMSTYPGSPMTSAVYTTLPGSRRSLESVTQSMAQFGAFHNQPSTAQQPRGYRGAAEV